jgi:hypothetical protein
MTLRRPAGPSLDQDAEDAAWPCRLAVWSPTSTMGPAPRGVPEETGLALPILGVSALATAIGRALGDEARARDLGGQARQSMLECDISRRIEHLGFLEQCLTR